MILLLFVVRVLKVVHTVHRKNETQKHTGEREIKSKKSFNRKREIPKCYEPKVKGAEAD